MGLAASQARLLFITGRKCDVEYAQMKIANEKISLSRESTAEAEEYSRALSQRKLTWTTGPDTSVDLSYGLLMSPNTTVNNGQYLVTDVNGRVVLSDDLKSKLGLSAVSGTGGQFKSAYPTSSDFLVKMMGISKAEADQYATVSGNTVVVPSAATTLNEDINNLSDSMGDSNFNSVASCTLSESVYQAIKPIIEGMQAKVNATLSSTTISDTEKDICKKIKADIDVAQKALEVAHKADTSTGDGRSSAMAAIATIKALFNGTPVVESLPEAGVHNNSRNMDGIDFSRSRTNEQGWATVNMVDNYFNSKTGLGGINYNTPYKNNIVDLSNSLGSIALQSPSSTSTLTAQGEADFYVNQYNALSSKGWKCDSNISDKDYMQNGIRNGNFYLQQLKSSGWSNLSSGDASSPVNDVLNKDEIAKAEAQHEIAQSKLSTKEEQLDLKMKNLDTERAALDTEVDSVKAVINKNIERSFKMFQA